MTRAALAICLAVTGITAQALPAGAQTAGPMSAIDWLSHSLDTPAPGANAGPVSGGIRTEVISVRPLGSPSPDGVGLLPRSVTGLPANLWGESDLNTLIRMISEFPISPLPAVQDQFRRLMLAELDPPRQSTGRAPLLQARIDALLARGAVEEAEALLERAGTDEPQLFRRAFDVGLLTGREQAACARMRAVPGISPSFPVRIFCLARTDDWNAAAVTLESAKALGQLTPEEDAMLAQFLDPELAEVLPPVVPPARPSPLMFRMMEAIGESLPTSPLPVAFAHSDLRPIVGWKARVEAAERLARVGAIPAEVLVAIYGERRPAASGGVWDRVAAVQTLGAALSDGDATQVDQALPAAWNNMRAAGLAVPFARAFGPQLAGLGLSGRAAALAPRIGLLSDSYETVAIALEGSDTLPFAAAVARGIPPVSADTDLESAIAAGFATPLPVLTREYAEMIGGNRQGEALLTALRTLAAGRDGDPDDITAALVLLRKLGFEDAARSASLQMLLLEPAR
ncbi:hypothetical protein [Tropicimonas sp.]|uniref:hypothetical protein n=1 Tax=Tropicimonas sp. TaxID=2067044 RepID=UPI003A8860C6